MASVLEKRFNSVIREAVTATLTPHGFRKRGRVYRRQLDELVWVIDIQRSRYNSYAETQFTLNCGVYVPRVSSLYLGLPEPTNPTSVDCCIHVRVGMLAYDRLDQWWTLHDQPGAALEDGQIVRNVRERISLHALSFLKRFPTTLEVAKYLDSPRPRHEAQVYPYTEAMAYGCAGIIYLIRGEREASRNALAKAVEDAMGTLGEDHLRSLEHRLLSEGLPE
jgi:hypothetical protein